MNKPEEWKGRQEENPQENPRHSETSDRIQIRQDAMTVLDRGTVRTVDTREYVSVLRELVREGKEVSMTIAGSSMSPFLCHGRDRICFKEPWREPRRGDMVFYERPNGQFVMHRILRRTSRGYDIIGDAQIAVEHGVRREQIFAVITKVCRKGKWMQPGDFWWEFFEHIWLRVIPLRRVLTGLYGKIFGRKKKKED